MLSGPRPGRPTCFSARQRTNTAAALFVWASAEGTRKGRPEVDMKEAGGRGRLVGKTAARLDVTARLEPGPLCPWLDRHLPGHRQHLHRPGL